MGRCAAAVSGRSGAPTVAGVETTSERARFTDTLRAVQAYVRSEPGAHSSLMDAARRDPEATTSSLVSLGTVLLDIAAGAFRLTPDEMLDKVAARVAEGSDVALP
jgi:hypothetical protein